MNADRVEGGTNAGWKQPFNGQAAPWQCDCFMPRNGDAYWSWSDALRKTNLGALTRCPVCGRRRTE